MRELFMTTDNFGITDMTMDEQFKLAAELGFTGIEHHFPATRELVDCLKKYNLKMIHSEIPFNADDTLDNVDILHEIGVKYIAARVRARTHEEALRTADELNRVGKIANSMGFKLFFHNMATEFIFDRGEYLYETLLKNTDPVYVCSQMDLGWVVGVGADPVPLLKKYPGRVEMMHVKPCTKIYGLKTVMPLPKPGSTPPAAGSIFQQNVKGGDDPRSKFMEMFRTMQGPFSELVRDYQEPMEVAESLGCRCFIYEREQYYHDDRIAIMKDDIAGLRKFW